MLQPGRLVESQQLGAAVSQSVKRRVRVCCEMATNLGVKTVGRMSHLWDIRQLARTLPLPGND
jgi:hypothetical protein